MIVDVNARGFYVACPNCEKELRIAAKYAGRTVQCRFCSAPFVFDRGNPAIRRIAFYADCPHCKVELRAAEKYMQQNVACKFCSGAIRFVDPGRETV